MLNTSSERRDVQKEKSLPCITDFRRFLEVGQEKILNCLSSSNLAIAKTDIRRTLLGKASGEWAESLPIH